MGTNERKHKKFIRQLIYVGIAGLVFVGVLLYGRELEQRSTHFYVKFKNPGGNTSQEFKLEIADKDSDREKGLMYRKEMPENEGMIFIYPSERMQVFWMKNTYIPLDMLFVDQKWNVAGILKNVPVLNTDQRKIDKESMYVIELNGGEADKNGIKEGSTVTFNDAPPKAKD